jgi:hypothetical protein
VWRVGYFWSFTQTIFEENGEEEMVWKVVERDWKYLQRIRGELLDALCRRVNAETVSILQKAGPTEHEKYLNAYKHIQNSDRVIAKCFDDWRRSVLDQKLIILNRFKLLTQDHLDHFSNETRELLQGFEKLRQVDDQH